MDAMTAELPLAASKTSICEHCDKPFEPRKGSGGKPQRFCNSECRAAFHADAQHSQRSPTCDPTTGLTDTQEATVQRLMGEARKVSEPEPDFDWGADAAVILADQQGVAAYFNPEGCLVLRQRRLDQDEDAFIFIHPGNTQAFLDKICDLLGVFSAP